MLFNTSGGPDAFRITLDEEAIRDKYPWDYSMLSGRLRKRYSDFKITSKYHSLRKSLEGNSVYCLERLLDPGNPKSAKKIFYNPNIIKEFDKHYQRRSAETLTVGVEAAEA